MSSSKPSETEPEYNLTLFDRHGPAAGELLRAWAYGLLVFALTISVTLLAMRRLSGMTLLVAAAAGLFATAVALIAAHLVGRTAERLAVGGSSTPYVEQYSYQQALVMRGQLDEALASFEAIIAERPDALDARLRAAELYARERQDPRRAAELLRDVQRAPAATAGQFVQATNRLVDLLLGPLNEPGRAQVELRRMIERLPGTAAASHARAALATLKTAQRQTKIE